MENLGRTGTDTITGFSGVITGFAAYISGCNQYLLVPGLDKKTGQPRESHWYDVQRVKLGKAKQVVLDNSDTPGSDKEAPKR